MKLEQAPLEKSWHRAWTSLGAQGDGAALMTKLLSAYSEPQREYHTLQHLLECVAMLEPLLPLAEHPGEVEIALWFHDAVYDTNRQDNEQQSAHWAERKLLGAGVSSESVERVKELIMATRHSALPSSQDAKLLVDVDLSILGAPRDRFQEYDWVPSLIFRRKRRAILAGFAAREHIYDTAHFRESLEARARANIRRSLSRLKPWYQFW